MDNLPGHLRLLLRMGAEGLPQILTASADVENVAVLVHAGQVEATMQVLMPRGEGLQIGVVVSRLTPLGCMTLESLSQR